MLDVRSCYGVSEVKKHAVKKHAVMHGMGIPNAEHGYLTIFSCCTRRLIVLTVNRGWIGRHKSMN